MKIAYEIPLRPSTPTIMSVVLAGKTYNLRFEYNQASEESWILDIADASLNLLIAGLPLVSGDDLLAQYAYLGIGGALVVTTDRGAGEVPGFDDFGSVAHLFFIEGAAS